jgi:branched-chain amino acid transport system permease protein
MLQSALVEIADNGSGYAVMAVCIILLYRTTGVLNFGIAATGTAGIFVLSSLYSQGLNLVLATLVGLIAGGVISLACGLIYVRYFFEATPAYRGAVAIAFLISIIAITLRVFGDQARLIPTVLGGSGFTLDGVIMSRLNIASMLFAILFTVVITTMLNRSRRGLQLRAISQGPVASELLGLPVRPLSLAIWGGSGVIATLAMAMIVPGVTSEISSLSLLVVPALAAALFAAFRRYWLAFIAALIVAALQGLMSYSARLINYTEIVPFGIILVVLMWNQRREVWDEAR